MYFDNCFLYVMKSGKMASRGPFCLNEMSRFFISMRGEEWLDIERADFDPQGKLGAIKFENGVNNNGRIIETWCEK